MAAVFTPEEMAQIADAQRKRRQNAAIRVTHGLGAEVANLDEAKGGGTYMTPTEKLVRTQNLEEQRLALQQFSFSQAQQRQLAAFGEDMANLRAQVQAAVQSRGQDIDASEKRAALRLDAAQNEAKALTEEALRYNALDDRSTDDMAAIKATYDEEYAKAVDSIQKEALERALVMQAEQYGVPLEELPASARAEAEKASRDYAKQQAGEQVKKSLATHIPNLLDGREANQQVLLVSELAASYGVPPDALAEQAGLEEAFNQAAEEYRVELQTYEQRINDNREEQKRVAGAVGGKPVQQYIEDSGYSQPLSLTNVREEAQRRATERTPVVSDAAPPPSRDQGPAPASASRMGEQGTPGGRATPTAQAREGAAPGAAPAASGGPPRYEFLGLPVDSDPASWSDIQRLDNMIDTIEAYPELPQAAAARKGLQETMLPAYMKRYGYEDPQLAFRYMMRDYRAQRRSAVADTREQRKRNKADGLLPKDQPLPRSPTRGRPDPKHPGPARRVKPRIDAAMIEFDDLPEEG